MKKTREMEIAEIAYIAGKLSYSANLDMEEMLKELYEPIYMAHKALENEPEENMIEYLYISKFAEDVIRGVKILKIELKTAIKYVMVASKLGIEYSKVQEYLILEFLEHGVENIEEVIRIIMGTIFKNSTESNLEIRENLKSKLDKI
jgi:hypothetical protein